MFASSLLLASSLLAGAFAAPRTQPPHGAILVGEGTNFTSIQDAVDSVSSPNSIIFVLPGIYEEQVLIGKPVGALTIYGYTEDDQDYSKNQVVITQGLGADEAGSNDASGTLRAKNDGLKVFNVNVVNSRGAGVQAIALSAYGDQQGYYGCQFSGHQDTILTNDGHHYFHGSYVEGAVDFIFGLRSIAWFERCTIGVTGTGWITASGRNSAANPGWYVINNSIIKGVNNVKDGVNHLGRPWRDYARVVFQNSEIDAVINKVGWTPWNTNNGEFVYYGEFNNTGAGAATDKRVSYSQVLDAAVSIEDIFESTHWFDSNYINNVKATAPKKPAATTLRTHVRETGAA